MVILWSKGKKHKSKRYIVAYNYDGDVLGYMATNSIKTAIYRCNKWPDHFVVDTEAGEVVHKSTYKRKA